MHGRAQFRRRRAATGVAELVEAGEVSLACIFGQVRLVGVGFQHFPAAQAGRAAEHDKVDQRVGAEAVRAMHRHAGRFANGHQARHDRVRIAARLGQHFAMIVRGDAAHVVVDGRQHRDRFLREVDAGKDLCAFRNAGQALVQDFRIEVVEVQVDMVLVRAHATAFADFHRHRAADNVTRGKVLHGRRITLHEALALRVGEIAAFTARALGDQAARAVDAGRMELHELHVLQRQACAQRHAAAIARAGVR